MNDFRGLIDLVRYPLDRPESSEVRALVRRCQGELDAGGVVEISGFLTDQGLRRMVEESASLEAVAYHNALVGNAYLEEPDVSLAPDHTRRMMEPTSLGAIAYDQIPPGHLLRQIYEWDALKAFIGEVLGLKEIYRYADPMGALNVAVMKDGDYLRWHFDQTDFVTSLAIRNAEEGGEFEYAPMLRTPDLENYDLVRGVIQGDRTRVKKLANDPGSLVLFKGRYSLHRVSPIKGKIPRLIGLLGFDSRPGTVSSPYLRRIRYGRAEALTHG